MNNFQILLESHTDIMEHYSAMRIDQPTKDRLRYMKIASEASLSSSGKSKMISQLYTDIISKANMNFGKIPNSKGNLTAYVDYDVLAKSLDNLNSLFRDQKVEELELANKLHDILISLRGDFEFGFKFDITIIKLTYNLLVMALYDMINICIVSYVDYLKDIQNVEYKFRGTRKTDIIIIKYVKDFIKSYQRGEWAKVVGQFKKDSSNLLGFVTGGSITGGPAVVISALAALLTIRGFIYVYYASSMKLNESLKLPAEFLKTSIELTDKSTPTNAVEKQKKFLSKLESISNFIETKILKTNKDAIKDLKKSNSEKYDVDNLKFSESGQIELL